MTDRRPFSDAYSPTPLAAPLRPATEARERAIALLTDGYAYDALTEAEFEWRLGELMRAESTAAIDALVSDLAPGRLVATGHDAAPVPAPSRGRLVGFMSESRRMGPWRVPHHLRILGVMSNMVVDLRYAVMPDDCEIEISAIMASVTILVSPTMVVDFDALPIMGSAKSAANSIPTRGSRPPLRVHGTAIMSEVQVKVRDLGR